jgi:pyridoxal phosphate enzyme (YggS family)
MSVRENLDKIKKGLPENVTLVAVSKTMPADIIMEAYNSSHRVFGENKAQELIRKQPDLPADIKWHFIGHLQTNKVKFLAPFVEMIESVDSLKLLKEINKQAHKNGRTIRCLLQFHIAAEETKFGLDMEEAGSLLESEECNQLNNIQICGVMGMATFTEDEALIRNEFRKLAGIFREIKERYFQDDEDFKELSMGMTGDYPIAIEEGSTIVRIGTAIFGEREYY